MNNKNKPPINPKTKANIANIMAKINTKGVKAKTKTIKNSFKPNINKRIAINISKTISNKLLE